MHHVKLKTFYLYCRAEEHYMYENENENENENESLLIPAVQNLAV